jgi:glycerol uptake facilitator-like aquaporin
MDGERIDKVRHCSPSENGRRVMKWRYTWRFSYGDILGGFHGGEIMVQIIFLGKRLPP